MNLRWLPFCSVLVAGLTTASLSAQGTVKPLPVLVRKPAEATAPASGAQAPGSQAPGAQASGSQAATPAGAELTPEQQAAADAAKEAQEKAKKQQEQQQQIQRLNAVRFDRRPTAILEAWAGLDLRRRAELEKKQQAAEAKAKAAAQDQGAAPIQDADVGPGAGGVVKVQIAPGTTSVSGTATRIVSGRPALTAPSTIAPPPPPPPTLAIGSGILPDDIPPELLEQMAAQAGLAMSQPGAAPAAAPADPSEFDKEVLDFQRNVTLGDWESVGKWIGQLDEPVAKVAYTKLVSLVGTAPPVPNQNSRLRMYAEKNVLSYADVIGVASAAPKKLDAAWTQAIGRLCRVPFTAGESVETFLGLLRADLEQPEEQRALNRRQTAKILFAANLVKEAREFLPSIELALKNGDGEGLNLVAQHHEQMWRREGESKDLGAAWEATQAALASDSEKVNLDHRQTALKRAVDLAPRVEDVLGQAWLAESFTEDLQRGKDALAAIGGAVSKGMVTAATDPERRLNGLRLQSTAVNALLGSAPERASEWTEMLGLLAMNWLREAQHSYRYDEASALGKRVQTDVFGNVYYQNWGYNRNPTPVTALNSGEVLQVRPQDAWLDAVPGERKAQFSKTFAELFLKVGEDEQAFPYIERLCRDEPDIGRQLINEFLRVWTRNHDPNSSQNSRASYIYAYGFNSTQSGIPLTRSKQDRNLRDLKALVAKLRRLPVDDIDDQLLVSAFETCHSRAEVYDFNDVRSVFGELKLLEPETIAGLAQSMRRNLLTVWRRPATQERAQTNRTRRDIAVEVTRGYGDGIQVIEAALRAHPGNWRLQLAMASLMHDRNDFLAELQNDSDYTKRRTLAFQAFQLAARFYAREVPELKDRERTNAVYSTWFHAALGACDLGAIDETKVAYRDEFEKIRRSMMALPSAAADDQVGRFANDLFRYASQVNPALKHDYLEAGFEICGDHERAEEAKDLFEYYSDLLTEIDLVVEIDGSKRVGSEEPFGVFVSIRHSAEIEREAGGFGKYLQDQQSRDIYNYGRPAQDYRSKFEEEARAALAETFLVEGITFQTPSVSSRAEPEYGWRKTPYAYLLLKARGPEVDTLPRLRLDLDFRDGTGGYVVLPIESSPQVVDARRFEERPSSDLEIKQTLDERQAKDGRLILEVSASARGLVPDLDEMFDMDLGEFFVSDEEERSLLVSKFDETAEEIAVRSERTWTLTLNANKDLSSLPDTFEFPEPSVEARSIFQRYVDADLESVEPLVALEATYGEVDKSWAWWVLGGVLLVSVLGFLLGRAARPEVVVEQASIEAPSELTAFTVLGFLRQVQQLGSLQDNERRAIQEDIVRLETGYFGADESAPKPELRELTGRWKLRVGA